MRKWIGTSCILLGFCCLLGAIGFAVYNRWEAANAEEVSKVLLEDVQAVIQKNTMHSSLQDSGIQETVQNRPISQETTTENASAEKNTEMATVQVDGDPCIGILSIPALGLNLPVLTDWSYAKLTKAPCLYYGSYYEQDFVIAAHNYAAHFGRLSELQSGDLIIFTDVNGIVRYYEVVLLETLPKEATMEMINSGFDLSLYTCTLGGGSRVTVRCRAVNL